MAKQKKQPKTKATKAAKSKKKVAAPWWKDKQSLLGLLAVIVLTFISLFPTLQNDFTNWDDPDYVTHNQYITKLDGKNIKAMFTEEIAYNYHPLTILSLAFDYQMSDRDPQTGEISAASFHRTNLLLHLINVVLVFWLVMLLGVRKEGAWLAALLFGVHPMHVESVAWIAERKDVLYGLFFLAGMIAYAKYLQAKLPIKYLAISLLLFILSGFSKPTAVVFPIVLLLMDYYRDRKWDVRMFVEKIPFFAFSIFIGLKTYFIQEAGAVGGADLHSIGDRILFVCYGITAYVGKLFVPIGLSTFHPYPFSGEFPVIYYIAPIITLALFAFVAFSLKKTKAIAFGFLFFLVVNALTLQFLTVGSSIISERYTYIPYVGLFFIIGYGVDFLMKQKRPGHASIKRSVYPIISIFCLIFIAVSFQQSKVWKNSQTLWTKVTEVYPNDPMGYDKLGNYYLEENVDLPKAIENLNKAVELPTRKPDPFTSRAKYYLETKQYKLAIEDCNTALKIKGKDLIALNVRGNANFSAGRLDEAMVDYTEVAKLEPNNFRNLGNMGAVYFQQGNYPKSIEFFDKAITANPLFTNGYLNRAVSQSRLKQYDKAIADFTEVLRLEPDHPKAYIWRAQDRYSKGDYKASLEDYNIAIQKAPSANILRGRARVHKALGNEAAEAADLLKAKRL